jgi:hypothetical protein
MCPNGAILWPFFLYPSVSVVIRMKGVNCKLSVILLSIQQVNLNCCSSEVMAEVFVFITKIVVALWLMRLYFGAHKENALSPRKNVLRKMNINISSRI